MVRDIRDRLTEFGADVEVEKIALTIDQVEEYGPPPNPAKTGDTRAEAYIEKYGDSSWEVDALPPDVLQGLIRARLEEIVDKSKMDAVIEEEEQDKALLLAAVEGVLS
jgi:hypothetical protein